MEDQGSAPPKDCRDFQHLGNRVPAERLRGTRGFGEQVIPKKISAFPRKA